MFAPEALAAEGSWDGAGTRHGVALQSRPTDWGLNGYRGSVTVCTDLSALEEFVTDSSSYAEWIAYAEEVRSLPDDGPGELYYMKSATPWPFRSRDMIYRLVRVSASPEAIRIRLRGEPEALAPQPGAMRMNEARGLWTLRPGDGRISVAFRLAADPGGRAPAFLANGRLADSVSRTLANLRDRFPCAPAQSSSTD